MLFSSHGVNEFHHGGVRFVTLDEWQTEFELFEKLQKICFFKRFKKSKAFLTWSQYFNKHFFHEYCSKKIERFTYQNIFKRPNFLDLSPLIKWFIDEISGEGF